jgi:hypothetical protein
MPATRAARPFYLRTVEEQNLCMLCMRDEPVRLFIESIELSNSVFFSILPCNSAKAPSKIQTIEYLLCVTVGILLNSGRLCRNYIKNVSGVKT